MPDLPDLEKKEIITGERSNLRILQLNKLQTANSLDLQTARNLNEILYRWHDNYMISAVILKGSFKSFCSGADALALRRGAGPENSGIMAGSRLRREVARLAYRTRRYQLPLLAMITGSVQGGGYALLQGQYNIATEDSEFSVKETLTGQALEGGLSFVLNRLKIGYKERVEMEGLGMALALTGLTLKGKDLMWAGIANYFESDEDLDTIVSEMERIHDKDLNMRLPQHMRKHASQNDLQAAYDEVMGVIPMTRKKAAEIDTLPEEYRSVEVESTDDRDADKKKEIDEDIVFNKNPEDSCNHGPWIYRDPDMRHTIMYHCPEKAKKKLGLLRKEVEAARTKVESVKKAAEAEKDGIKAIEEIQNAENELKDAEKAVSTFIEKKGMTLSSPPISDQSFSLLRENFPILDISQGAWSKKDAYEDKGGVEESDNWILDTEFGRERIPEPHIPGGRAKDGNENLPDGTWAYAPENEPLAEPENPMEFMDVFGFECCEFESISERVSKCFRVDSLKEAIDNLKKEETNSQKWASEALSHMKEASPFALKVVYEQMKRAEKLESLEDCLMMEVIVGDNLTQHKDFWSALRKTNKNDQSKWSDSLDDVDSISVDFVFERPTSFDFDLAGRD